MKKLQRLLALMLCALTLLTSIPVVAAAAEESKLSIATVGGRRGETVTVTVDLNQVNGIAGGAFNIRYDSTVLTLVKAEAGSALSGRTCTINDHYAKDLVRVSFAGTVPLNAAGTLLTMQFRISEAAPLGQTVLTAENVKLYDVDASVVTRIGEAGAVEVQSITIAIGSESCLPGQAVSLPVTVGGPLAPSGGEFEIHYNTRMLTGGTVKAADKLGNVGINLSYNVFKEEGYVKVSWAAAQPVSQLGELCTVIFSVDDSAAGDTAVTVKNVKFFDENAKRMDYNEPQNGTVTVVTSYNTNPILYVVGGQLAEDGKTATVQVAVDGAGLVCGGTFTLRYDTALCTLNKLTVVKSCVATNPETSAAVNGQIRASWAEDRSALDNETILELEFTLLNGQSVPLELSDVVLKNKNGLTMLGTQVHSGAIGIRSDVQAPITAVQNTEDAVLLNTTLYDAQFCGEEKTAGAQFILAAYTGGKMHSTSVPSEPVTFDHNGIAQISLELPFEDTVDHVSLFVLDTEGNMRPLCENAQIIMK